MAKDSRDYQSAVCGGGHEMTAGVHCAHFALRRRGVARVGVAGPGFDPAAGEKASESAEGWAMATWDGDLWHHQPASFVPVLINARHQNGKCRQDLWGLHGHDAPSAKLRSVHCAI